MKFYSFEYFYVWLALIVINSVTSFFSVAQLRWKLVIIKIDNLVSEFEVIKFKHF